MDSLMAKWPWKTKERNQNGREMTLCQIIRNKGLEIGICPINVSRLSIISLTIFAILCPSRLGHFLKGKGTNQKKQNVLLL